MDAPNETATIETDLRDLVDSEGPFLTAIIPTQSDTADAAERLRIQTNNALRDAPDEWADDVAEMESEVSALQHGDGAGLIAIRPHGGPTFYEFIADAVRRPTMSIGPLPRLAPLLEARQRTIPHVVVETDKAGADITAFDGGAVAATRQVEGDTEHIHRGHPGGWSQRRFQQRAENTWEENAKEVAESAQAMAKEVEARVLLVTGPIRARSILVKLLEDAGAPTRSIEAGDDDGIAEEVVRNVADIHATDTKAVLEAIDERVDHRAESARHVESSLAEGRVETLLVHDADDAEADGDRVIDRCIAAALRTGAEIRVVPKVAWLDDGVAAILRW